METAIPLVLASSFQEVFDNSMVLVVGMCVTMTVLASIYLMCLLIGKMGTILEPPPVPQAPVPAPPPPPSSEQALASDDPNPVPVAIIAAAVAALIDQPHQIIAIGTPAQSHWQVEGRRQHFSSHRVR